MVKTVLSMIGLILCLSACQVGVNPPSYVRPWTPAVAAIALPTATESAPVPVPTAWPRYIASPPKVSALPELAPSPGVSADEGQAVTGPAVVCCAGTVASASSGGSGGSESPRVQLRIQEIMLEASGESVMGPDAEEFLTPDYQGEPIVLRITGDFYTPQFRPLTSDDFMLESASPWQAETFLGETPVARVILNESLLLIPSFVSGGEIRVVLDPKYIPDLYLKGMHRLRVEYEDWYTDALLKVGDPVPPPESLAPVITQVEVLRQSGEPRFIQLTGQHFMLYPKFSHATVDGEFGFGYRTQVTSDGVFTTQIHVPDPATFDQVSDHLVIYTTPYGVAFYEF